MEKIREKLKGYKTYILGGLAVIGAIVSYFVGDASLNEAAAAVWAALTAMAVGAKIDRATIE